MTQDQNDGRPEDLYVVVRNHEEQYSIWRSDRAVPPGWEAIGPARPKQECLDTIAQVWTDMRPASLRRSMAEAGLAG